MEAWKSCIDSCNACFTACNFCALSCLGEKDVQMLAKCIALDMECAAFCRFSSELMSMESTSAKDICRLCAQICDACGNECAKHEMEHCRQCAEACMRCAKECQAMLA
jgi:hypothetical protein